MKTAYLGPEGSYSMLAARKLCNDGEIKEYKNFSSVMNALLCGECDYAVLPVENSLNGGVNQNIDLIQNTPNIIAIAETAVEIDHRLAVLKGTDLRGISRIYSHQQALAQCDGYIKSNFPNALLVATPSTAASLNLLKSSADACIVGAHTKRAEITLSQENISDEKCNVTHFLLFRKGEADEFTHTEKIFFSATCPHCAGALLKLLKPLSDGGMNMTKIQSRPIKDEVGSYRFFIEADGDYASLQVKAALENVKKASTSFKLLGAY